MAPSRSKKETTTARSSLDALAASGYVWRVTDDDQVDNRVVREDQFENRVDFLKVLSMAMLVSR